MADHTSSTPSIIPGAEPLSHIAGSTTGVLVLHGFTGNPSSVRVLAEAAIAEGYDVEMPRLPGHGTTVDDMMTTGWDDWFGAALQAFDDLAERCQRVVVAGLSMGGLLTLSVGGARSVAGLICVNPVARMRSREEVEIVEELIADHGGVHEVQTAERGDDRDPFSKAEHKSETAREDT